MTVDIVTREEWGATDWQTKTYAVQPSERTEFFTHWHGGPPAAQRGVWVPRNVEAIHLANGWAGTGYNFMVDMDGVAFEGRGWSLVGAHCPGHNRSGWAVYFAVGQGQVPTPEALATARALYDEGCDRAGFALRPFGHRDGKSTECPGDVIYAWTHGGMPADLSLVGSVPEVAPAGPPLLRKGSAGRHVELLQQQLLALGYQLPRYGADSDFGAETEAAVRMLQATAGIGVDGIVGPQTRAAIARGVRAPAFAPGRPIGPQPRLHPFPYPSDHYFGPESPSPRCHSGYWARDRAHVNALLQALRNRGWRDVPRTDRYTAGVLELVRKYQADAGLARDGLTGPRTWQSVSTSPIR